MKGDIVHTKVVFEDQFSFAKETRIVTVSRPTFEKMKAGVGSTFSKLINHIRFDFKVMSVEQATPEDYNKLKKE